MKFKKILFIIGLFLVVIAVFILKTFMHGGGFLTIEPHCKCTCSAIEGAVGAEDIAVDHVTGTAYISSHDRREYMSDKNNRGAILALDISGTEKKFVNLTEKLPFEFRPHGISFIRSEGKKFLFAVNHRTEGDYIEIFEIRGGELKHLESLHDSLMISINDVAAAGRRRFYFTNDHGSNSKMGRTIEDYLQLKKSTIVYYDGAAFSVAADNIAGANGIALSADRKTLYCSAFLEKAVHIYKRTAEKGKLLKISSIDVGTMPDNIDIDARGKIRVAGHPRIFDFLKHRDDRTKKAPSQVLEIFADADGRYGYREIYLNGGNEISAASVGTVYKDLMLIGSVYEEFILICRMNEE